MIAVLHRLSLTFAITTLLLLSGASLLHAQTPTPTPTPETPEERHVGLWLADWQRVPITFPKGGALSQIIDWSADGERLLLSIYYPNAGATGPFFAFFAPATDEVTPIMAGSPPTLANIPFDPVWDQEYRAIVYLQYRGLLTTTSAYAPVAEVVAIDEQGTVVREFTPLLLTDRESAARLVKESYPEVVGYPTSNDVSVSHNGRVSILRPDRIITMRVGEADRTLSLPVAIAERLQNAPPSARAQAGFPPEPQLWVAPNAEYYALAITRTLSIFESGNSIPLHEIDSPCPGEFAPISYASGLEWSPDSRSYYFQFVGQEGLVHPCTTYVQRIQDEITTSAQKLPRIEGNYGAPTAMTWHPTGPWIVLYRPNAAQCAGGPGYGCVHSQTLIDQYGMQTPITWWTSDLRGDVNGIRLWDRGVWSPTTRRLATGCSRYSWIDGDLTSESAICFFDFSWEKPAVDACQRPLAENLYCGDPDAFLP